MCGPDLSGFQANVQIPIGSPLKGSVGQTYNKIGIFQKSFFGVYGTWDPLDGCKILPWGVGMFPPPAETVLKVVVVVIAGQVLREGFFNYDFKDFCVLLLVS